MNEPTEFVVGQQYTNRKGTYTVLALDPPGMRVRYDTGEEENLDQAIQRRIFANMTLPPRTPEPPPRRKFPVRSPAKAPAAPAPRPIGAAPAPAPAHPPAAASVRTRGRRAASVAPTLTTTIQQLAAMADREEQPARQDALAAVLSSSAAFLAFVDRSQQAVQSNLQAFSVAHINRLHETDPAPTLPEQLLGYAVAQNRAYLAAEGQEILAWRFPLYEAGTERYAIDLLCYDEHALQAILVCTRTQTTVRRWLWEGLLDSLRNWVAVGATANFAAALDGYPLASAPQIAVLSPAAVWADNAPGAGAHTAEVAAGHDLNRRLLAALEDWLAVRVLLLQVPDTWLRNVGDLDHPHVSPAPLPRGPG